MVEEEEGGGGLVRFIFYWCVFWPGFGLTQRGALDTREGWRRVIGEEEKVRRG